MPSAVHRILAAVTAAMLLVTWGISAQVHGRWLTTKFAPLPQPAEEYWSAAANGKMYVLGGSATKWETRRPVPTPRNHPAVGVAGGKIYLIGGRPASANVGNFVARPTDVFEFSQK